MRKIRADRYLADHELAADTKEAAAFIMAGLVFFGDRRIEKPGELVPEGWQLSVKGKGHPYVSRGGVKLAAALREWGLSVLGKVCLDLGSSTGGFTDCMLQAGASKVFAVDAGSNQLDWRLRNDPRVVAMEGTNARDLKPEDLGVCADFATLDLSFISLEKVLPVLLKIVKPSGFWVALIKPQFEAEKHEVPAGGVLSDSGLQKKICDKIWAASERMGLGPLKLMKSPISGKDGNIEFLLLGQIK